MIRMIQSVASDAAKKYFNDSLIKADYYINDQELKGRYFGNLAARLGLKEEVTKDSFYKLCDNINPSTNDGLTSRTIENRRVGYDINFHCPKSVSILHVLSKDDHILKAFQESVRSTMLEIEKDAKTRVRVKGQFADRFTKELAWGEFIHQTARPVEGHSPDPHLHAHCFVFNATWDSVEKKFKAGQFGDIKRDMPYYQALFHKTLSDKLIEKGYEIDRTRSSFEIKGVPKYAIDHFSKRTNEIGEIAKEKGITDAKELDKLGALSRSKKDKGKTMEELRLDWKKQLKALSQENETSGFVENNHKIRVIDRHLNYPKPNLYPAQECINHVRSHAFERASVVPKRRFLAESYRHAIGEFNTSSDSIDRALKTDIDIFSLKENGREFLTTKEVLREEYKMVELAKEGFGSMKPIFKKAPKLNLKGAQKEAVRDVLTNTNRISIIRGAAGTGKTTLMKEAIEKIESQGVKVQVVAPTAQAAQNVLREEGFQNSTTIANFLLKKEIQQSIKNQVLWVDEAGMIGTKEMSDILALTKSLNVRVIFGGDTRQHNSVVRGDALRILNTVAGVKTSEVSKIYRQKNQFYKEAVNDLSKGNVLEAFEKLDELEFLKGGNGELSNELLVSDYLDAVKKKKSTLIISPTHKHGEQLTQDIRKALREENLLGKREVKVSRLKNLNLTEAEKMDHRNLFVGSVIQAKNNTSSFVRGQKLTVEGIDQSEILIKDKNGILSKLSLKDIHKFDVYSRHEIGLSIGDKVIITKNQDDKKKNRLNNGQELVVKSVTKKGDLKLKNPNSPKVYTLDKEDLHLTHGHVITSHASQGKTVDQIFISQHADTFPATDLKQFYVSVSRGREAAHIYVDDLGELYKHASRMGDRKSAMELVNMNGGIEALRRSRQRKIDKEKEIEKKNSPNKVKGYEPEI